MLTGGGVLELTLRDESYSHLTLGLDVFTAALCRRLCTGRPVRGAESTAKREHRVLPGSLAWRSVGVLWLPNDWRFYCSAFSRTVNQTAAECGNQGGVYFPDEGPCSIHMHRKDAERTALIVLADSPLLPLASWE